MGLDSDIVFRINELSDVEGSRVPDRAVGHARIGNKGGTAPHPAGTNFSTSTEAPKFFEQTFRNLYTSKVTGFSRQIERCEDNFHLPISQALRKPP